jgi:hypothetical protein
LFLPRHSRPKANKMIKCSSWPLLPVCSRNTGRLGAPQCAGGVINRLYHLKSNTTFTHFDVKVNLKQFHPRVTDILPPRDTWVNIILLARPFLRPLVQILWRCECGVLSNRARSFCKLTSHRNRLLSVVSSEHGMREQYTEWKRNCSRRIFWKISFLCWKKMDGIPRFNRMGKRIRLRKQLLCWKTSLVSAAFGHRDLQTSHSQTS